MPRSTKIDNAFRFTLAYLVLGALWIYFSDTIVDIILTSPRQQQIYQTAKGMLYVASTALLLYIILRRFYRVQLKTRNALRATHRTLQKAENRYILLFNEQSAAGIIIDANSGIIEDINIRAAELLGCSNSDVIGKSIEEIFPDYYRNIAQTHASPRTTTYTHSNGRHTSVEISSIAFQESDTDYLMLLCHDVTFREETLSELTDLKQKLMTAQKIAKIGYWRLSGDTGTLFWSDMVYEILGVRRNEQPITYDKLLQMVHPDDRHLFPQETPFSLEDYASLEIEHRIITEDGTVKWVREIGSVNTNFGAVPYLEGTVQDITDQKTTSLQLEENLQRYNWMVQAISDAIWDWDLQQNTITWYPGATHTLSQLAQLSGMRQHAPWEEHIISQDRPRVIDSLQQALEHDTQFWNAEYRCKTLTNTYLFVSSTAYILRDNKGKAVKVIGTITDITEDKRKALHHEFTQKVRSEFETNPTLEDALHGVLEYIRTLCNFHLAEAWLVGREKKSISLCTAVASGDINHLLDDEKSMPKSFKQGESLVGACWQQGELLVWENLIANPAFKRAAYAEKANINCMYAVPLKANNDILGVILLGLEKDDIHARIFSNMLFSLYSDLAAEIRRKQAELDLKQLFEFVPDIVCIAGSDGYFKKVNPMLTEVLGYTEAELLGKPVLAFVHPQDIAATEQSLKTLALGERINYFENRYVTKDGGIRWIAWTSTEPSNDGLVISVGRDITEKKELELLLTKATAIARVGAWEIDLVAGKMHWSAMTREIHGIQDPTYNPSFEEGHLFYKEGYHRNKIIELITKAIEKGEGWDTESMIITLQNQEKWVRSVGEPEFINGNCVRIVGSFQDIDERRKSELAAIAALQEKETILERIGDAFFAVDKDWTITYWNNVAAEVLKRKRQDVMGKKLWDIYNDEKEAAFYTRYQEAAASGQSQYFQAYYAGLDAWFDVGIFPSDSGLSIFFRDITERKRYIQTIEQQNLTLREIAWSQSHEVRAPLATLIGLVQLIEDQKQEVSDEMQEILDMVLVSAHELDTVVKRVTNKTYGK